MLLWLLLRRWCGQLNFQLSILTVCGSSMRSNSLPWSGRFPAARFKRFRHTISSNCMTFKRSSGAVVLPLCAAVSDERIIERCAHTSPFCRVDFELILVCIQFAMKIIKKVGMDTDDLSSLYNECTVLHQVRERSERCHL